VQVYEFDTRMIVLSARFWFMETRVDKAMWRPLVPCENLLDLENYTHTHWDRRTMFRGGLELCKLWHWLSYWWYR